MIFHNYNAAGQKTSFTDGRGKVTTYSYHSDDLPSGITYPDSTGSTVTYNTDGQVATSTDGRGVVVTNNYNTGGQLTSVSYSDSTPTVSFAYNDDGAKTSMTDGTGTTTYSYDTGGRITTRTSPQGAVTYSYNNANALTGKVGGGSTLLYSYDDAGRMTALVAGGTQATSYSYDNANRMTSTTLPDGSVETKTYTAAADLASIESVKSGTTITSSSYSYDALGRKTSETTPSYALAYTYDNGGQLTSEVRTGASAYSVSYTYDNAGNRATKTLGGTTENYSYDDANKLLTAGGKSYSYDNAGNMTGVSWSGGSTSLTWNGAGYLKSASDGSTTINYAYNGLGQRVGKSGGASASYILSDDSIDSQVLSDGAASFVHGASGLVSENRGGTSKFYHADALGSVKALTDGSGSVTDSRSTDAFGMLVTSSGSTPTPFGFAGNHGYQQDSETGLMRLGHRMYDASTGRFISRDPIRDGYNWYAYCGNDPVNAVDPQGLKSVKELWHTFVEWIENKFGKKPQPKNPLPEKPPVEDVPSNPEPPREYTPREKQNIENLKQQQIENNQNFDKRKNYEKRKKEGWIEPEDFGGLCVPAVPISYPEPNDGIPDIVKDGLDNFGPGPAIGPRDVIGIIKEYVDPFVKKARKGLVDHYNE